MDEILLYLSLKHDGDWMAIYDSLQKKEEIKVYDVKKASNEVDAGWITLISSDYPQNLKKIYKPPFGVLCYGKQNLLHDDMVTIYGDLNESNRDYVKSLKEAGVKTIWVNKSNKEIQDILNQFPEGNVFSMKEMKNDKNVPFHKLLENENVISKNAFVSEIWERNPKIDYSRQQDERLHLGLSLKTLIISELKPKELNVVSDYCSKEDIKVAMVNKALTPKAKEAFKLCKVNNIENCNDCKKVFGLEQAKVLER